MAKHYRSDQAAKLAAQRQEAARRQQERASKQFQNRSNPHHGASLGQSGQPKRGRP